jgi:hypothetical protein
MKKWTRAATGTGRTAMRAKRARQRVRSGTMTGEIKKIDLSETPDRDSRAIDISETPDREVPAESFTRS